MEAYYIAALKRVKGLGDRRIAELLNRFSSAKELWESDMEKIRSLGLLQDKTIENFQKYRADNKNYPEKLFEECKSKNIKAISIKDEAYPYPLKQRILGKRGHLSNEASGRLLTALLNNKMQRIFLSHLSHENNMPELAYEAVRMEVEMSDTAWHGDDFPIDIARRDEPSECIEL